MFETSKDLLYIILAFCILWFTAFVCWALYYIISVMRSVAKITDSAKKKMQMVDDILKLVKLVKDKLDKGSNHMSILADSAIKLVGFVMDKQKKSTAKSKKKKS